MQYGVPEPVNELYSYYVVVPYVIILLGVDPGESYIDPYII